MKTTLSLKPASFGTISHGTLRSEDLLNAFANELEWQIRRNGDFLSRPENFPMRDRLNAVVNNAWECFDESGEALNPEKEESGEVDEMVNETLPDALSEFAPLYGYFGTHPGDGSDFGFWVEIESVKEQVEFVSSVDQEYPDDSFRGEWLHVNKRGNCTLYVRECGTCSEFARNGAVDREVWAIV